MKFRITLSLFSLVFMSVYAQQSVSANQLEGLLNGGYANVQSMEHHEGKKNAKPVNTTRSSTAVKEKVTAEQLQDMMNQGYTNVQSMNYHQSNNTQTNRSSQNTQVKNHTSSKATNSGQNVTLASNGKIDLGNCSSKEEGKMAMINGGQKVYQCHKANWVRIK